MLFRPWTILFQPRPPGTKKDGVGPLGHPNPLHQNFHQVKFISLIPKGVDLTSALVEDLERGSNDLWKGTWAHQTDTRNWKFVCPS